MASQSELMKEVQKIARVIVGNAKYQEMLLIRAQSGVLAPAVETMLWHYAFAKPADKLEVKVNRAMFKGMSEQDLLRQFQEEYATLQTLASARVVAQQAVALIEEERTPQPEQPHFADLVTAPTSKRKDH
jgi:hypothetical protein